MLVNEGYRKCVSFLYIDREARGGVERVPVGTVFFVQAPIEDVPGLAMFHVVTARHVIEQVSARTDRAWVRVPQRDGTFVDRIAPSDSWESHPQTDVAVAAIGLNVSTDDVLAIATQDFVTPERSEQLGISEGDDVFFAGLFVGHPGATRPQPLIRFGNIALMPRELVRLKVGHQTYKEVDAYLVEARSWGGQSGSPAFLSFLPHREPGVIAIGTQPPTLLGLVQGHWEEPEGMKAPDPSGENLVEINMGISAVIPAEKILEVLMDEYFTAQRREQAMRVWNIIGQPPVPDAEHQKPEEEE